ncbi:MAG: DUF4321 domain-containing protein [Lachnoclostridium sp.]|jgi:hypothetical protein
MANVRRKNSLVLILLILAGVVLGSFLGYLAKDISYLSWLNYGQEFSIGGSGSNGILLLNLGILILRFGLTVKITIASLIGVVLAIIIYRMF